MDAFEVREKLLIGLRNVVLETGDSLEFRLTNSELHDIANTLTHAVPKGIQFNMTNIQTEILSNIPNAPTTERLYGDAGSAVLPSDTAKDLKHKMFIIFYTLFLLGEDIDKAIDDMFAFYRSFVIDTLDLKEEVAKNFIPATTIGINQTEVVRIGNDGKFVPTTKTIKQFNNLL